MKLLRHPVAAMVLFAVLLSLLIPVYKELEKNYGIEETDTGTYTPITEGGETTTGNIAEQLKGIGLIEGLSSISSSIEDIAAGSSILDLLGGLAGAALGILKSVLGLITIPYDIGNIISNFYGSSFPQLTGIIMMIVVYVGFILLSAYLRKDV